MSNARDERDWLKNNPDGKDRTPEVVYSPAEEVGDMHFSSENFTTAIEYLQKALDSTEHSADQDRFRILLKICDCHRQKGNYQEAQEALDGAGDLSAKFATNDILGKIEYRQAYLLLTKGQYNDALRASFSAYRKLKNSDEHGDVASIQPDRTLLPAPRPDERGGGVLPGRLVLIPARRRSSRNSVCL